MLIYLIGYMGCGKSTVGKRLAQFTGSSFVDLDKYIEERNCKTVPVLFAEFGEEAFRIKEHQALLEVSQFTNAVVATGGGTPCFFDNMEIMNKSGKTVFLDVHPSILAHRLKKSKTERPLIKGKSEDELELFIAETLKSRRKFYELSVIHIFDHEILVENLMHILFPIERN